MSLWKLATPLLVVVAALLGLSGCSLFRGSDYPSRDITFIIPYAPGGTTDPTSRLLGQESEPVLKVKLNMVNKAGASATLGTSEVAQAKPDGYTIGLTSTTATAIQPHIMSGLPYRGPEDYQPIIKVIELQESLTVRPDAPWKTIADFVADAKKRPGELKVSVSANLGADDLTLRDFGRVAGFQVTHVPFTGGGGESITALLGGHVDATMAKVGTIVPMVEAKQVRVLSVFQKKRSSALPDVPVAVELGYKTVAPGSMYFVLGPKGLDKAITDKLYRTFADAIKGPAYQKYIKDNGYVADPEVGPEALTKEVRGYLDFYGSLIKELNLQPEKK